MKGDYYGVLAENLGSHDFEALLDQRQATLTALKEMVMKAEDEICQLMMAAATLPQHQRTKLRLGVAEACHALNTSRPPGT